MVRWDGEGRWLELDDVYLTSSSTSSSGAAPRPLLLLVVGDDEGGGRGRMANTGRRGEVVTYWTFVFGL